MVSYAGQFCLDVILVLQPLYHINDSGVIDIVCDIVQGNIFIAVIFV